MNIFVAGATGALGAPVVRALIERGHRVTGLTRSAEKRGAVEALGAEAAVADALDTPALKNVVRAAEPDCVLHLLTALPTNGPLRFSHLKATNRLRTAGTANLLRASVAAGARRFVAESMVFAYGYGDHGDAKKTEADPVRVREASPGLQEAADAVRSLESQSLEAAGNESIGAVVLRYGFLYGPKVPSTVYWLRMLRRRMMPVVRGTSGLLPFVHADDAVSATVAAVEHSSSGGIYNVVDDEPVSMNDWFRFAANSMGAPAPLAIPRGLFRLAAPYAAAALATRLPVSNAKAKREMGWTPRFPSYRDGIREMLGDMAARITNGETRAGRKP